MKHKRDHKSQIVRAKEILKFNHDGLSMLGYLYYIIGQLRKGEGDVNYLGFDKVQVLFVLYEHGHYFFNVFL